MDNRHVELIWRGRMHIGDEPGIYGDASYVGLGIDLPVTVRPFPDQDNLEDRNELTFLLEADNVAIPQGYPAHRIIVVQHHESDESNHWEERVIAEGRLDQAETTLVVDLGGIEPLQDAVLYLSIRVQIDTEVPPGLYDDIVVRSLSLYPDGYYASLGFRR